MKRFIVLRNCPPEGKDLEGRWYEVDSAIIFESQPTNLEGTITFGRTRRFEMREGGEQAEVFEPCEPVT